MLLLPAGVEYAIPDAYLHIAGGIPWEQRLGAGLGGRKLAAAAAKRPSPPPPAARKVPKAAPAPKKVPKVPAKRPSPPPPVRRPPPPPPPKKAATPAAKAPVNPNDAYYKLQWALVRRTALGRAATAWGG